jgi:hypothetical protein
MNSDPKDDREGKARSYDRMVRGFAIIVSISFILLIYFGAVLLFGLYLTQTPKLLGRILIVLIVISGIVLVVRFHIFERGIRALFALGIRFS